MNDLHHVELTRSQVSRFRRLAKGMRDLLEEIRREIPEANMYLEDGGNWYILSGDSHTPDGRAGRDRARHDRVLTSELVPHSSGGAW